MSQDLPQTPTRRHAGGFGGKTAKTDDPTGVNWNAVTANARERVGVSKAPCQRSVFYCAQSVAEYRLVWETRKATCNQGECIQAKCPRLEPESGASFCGPTCRFSIFIPNRRTQRTGRHAAVWGIMDWRGNKLSQPPVSAGWSDSETHHPDNACHLCKTPGQRMGIKERALSRHSGTQQTGGSKRN